MMLWRAEPSEAYCVGMELLTEKELGEREWNRWGSMTPTAFKAWTLGRSHYNRQAALSKVEFFDEMKIDRDTYVDNYTGTGLYHLYLDTRQRARSGTYL